jgi:hypothetical protein
MSKVLAQLEREFAPAAVLERFQRYLAATRPEFFSVPHFAETWAAWVPAQRAVTVTPYQPVSKTVSEEVNGRLRLIQVPLDDPRPAA